MAESTYEIKRAALTEYFDEQSYDDWAALTSDTPVSGIRATVRQGRCRMAELLMDWLPGDLSGARVLDAGCGAGGLAMKLARRGADVVAVDVSPRLVETAIERTPKALVDTIDYRVGDMCDPSLGTFDYVVAMDSLIHYDTDDLIAMTTSLAERTSAGLLFTVAPATPLLRTMHVLGKAFPKSDRSPDIQPVPVRRLIERLEHTLAGDRWRKWHDERISSGFYMSHGIHWVRP